MIIVNSKRIQVPDQWDNMQASEADEPIKQGMQAVNSLIPKEKLKPQGTCNQLYTNDSAFKADRSAI